MDQQSMEDNFDAFVVAPGSWIREFVEIPVRVTQQTFGYVPTSIDGPVWIDGSEATYGIPSDDLGHKIGLHIAGPEIDPNSPRRDPSKEAMKTICDTARRRFGVEEPLQNWKACLYTSTSNEDFILGRLGPEGFFASACSGHGFKMGPWIGKLLANFIDGADSPENYPRFCSK
jgi:sarcosine oxidase